MAQPSPAGRKPKLTPAAAAVLALVRREGAQTGAAIQKALAMRDEERRAAVTELRKAGLVETKKGSSLGMQTRTALYVFEPGKPPTSDRKTRPGANGLGGWR